MLVFQPFTDFCYILLSKIHPDSSLQFSLYTPVTQFCSAEVAKGAQRLRLLDSKKMQLDYYKDSSLSAQAQFYLEYLLAWLLANNQ